MGGLALELNLQKRFVAWPSFFAASNRAQPESAINRRSIDHDEVSYSYLPASASALAHSHHSKIDGVHSAIVLAAAVITLVSSNFLSITQSYHIINILAIILTTRVVSPSTIQSCHQI